MTATVLTTYLPIVRIKNLSIEELASFDEFSCPVCNGNVEEMFTLIRTSLSSFIPAFCCPTCKLLFTGRVSDTLYSMNHTEVTR